MQYITTIADAARWLDPKNPEKFARAIMAVIGDTTNGSTMWQEPAPHPHDYSTRVDFVQACTRLIQDGYNLPQKACGLLYSLLAEFGDEKGIFDMRYVWHLAGREMDMEMSRWGGDKRYLLLLNR